MLTLKEAWHHLPPQVQWAVREGVLDAEELARCASFWRWESSSFAAPGDVEGRVSYLGRLESARAAALAFGAPGVDPDALSSGLFVDHLWGGEAVRVTEVPLPGTLRVPSMLRILVDVRGPIGTVLGRASHNVWRRARPLADRALVIPVTEDAEIDRVSAELLVPYAERHGEQTHQIPLGSVRNLAHQGGLDSFVVDGEEVAARLGYSYERDGLRYYAAWRFGYPRAVFGDPERYGDFNGMNSLLAIRHAHETGHQMLDFGLSPAHPVENGQLQFKRMRGGAVSVATCHSFFSVRMPRGCAATFLWARPLFSVEGRDLVLNVGVPAGLSEAELLGRIHQKLVFKGVSLLRLHSGRLVGNALEAAIRAKWSAAGGAASGDGAPRIEVVAAPGPEKEELSWPG